MFCDEVQVRLIGGQGGNGCVSFRREKFVPRGGPNGGNGGLGGSIYLVADENINTLIEFDTHKIFRAKNGENGKGKDQAGADAETLFLPVPVGTMVFDEKKRTLLCDLKKHGDLFLACRGGKGGFGNAHFKSSTRQTPRFAELGEPGEDNKCTLELKLVADVGIIGLPSVGKSTMLSRISNARPKIADYHFTTLIPNLGLATLKEFGGTLQQSFLACDLPGLIEGAHKGKGLGIKFLKHVARNRVLVHLIDINSMNPVADFKVILKELKSFDKGLAKKPQLVAFNKIDTVDASTLLMVIRAFKARVRSLKKVYAISCVSGAGLKELMMAVWKMLAEDRGPASVLAKEEIFKTFRPHMEKEDRFFEVKIIRQGKTKSVFGVSGSRINQIAVMTNFSNPEAVNRVYDVFEKMNIHKQLRRLGAKFGDEIQIKDKSLLYRWD